MVIRSTQYLITRLNQRRDAKREQKKVELQHDLKNWYKVEKDGKVFN